MKRHPAGKKHLVRLVNICTWNGEFFAGADTGFKEVRDTDSRRQTPVEGSRVHSRRETFIINILENVNAAKFDVKK